METTGAEDAGTEEDGGADEAAEDVGEPVAGEIDGVGPAGVVGAAGSTWHWLEDAPMAAACEPASAAAVVPTQSTATPANTPNTEEPTRLPRSGTLGCCPS